MEALRQHVEKIVRPVRAGGWRKDKMREELLDHLVQRYEAKLVEGLDEQAACAAAIEQLGGPVALRHELQGTVPPLQCMLFVPLPGLQACDRWFDRDVRQSRLRWVVSRTFLVAVFTVGILLGLSLVVGLLAYLGVGPDIHGFGRKLPGHAGVVALALIGLLMVLSTAISYFLADMVGVRRALSNKSACSAATKAAALGVLIVVQLALLVIPLIYLIEAVAPDAHGGIRIVDIFTGSESGPLLLILGFLFFFVCLPAIGWLMKREHEQHAKWGRIEID